MSVKQEITKYDAAERQIDTAIELFFVDGEAVSAYTLTMAARDILYNLSQIENKRTGMDDFLAVIKPDYQGEVLRIIKEPQLFFKHAKKDPDSKLIFEPRSYEMVLLITTVMFAELAGYTTLNMEKYFAWHILDNPKMLTIPNELLPVGDDELKMLKRARDNIDKKTFWEFSETGFEKITLLKTLASTMMRYRNK